MKILSILVELAMSIEVLDPEFLELREFGVLQRRAFMVISILSVNEDVNDFVPKGRRRSQTTNDFFPFPNFSVDVLTYISPYLFFVRQTSNKFLGFDVFFGLLLGQSFKRRLFCDHFDGRHTFVIDYTKIFTDKTLKLIKIQPRIELTKNYSVEKKVTHRALLN